MKPCPHGKMLGWSCQHCNKNKHLQILFDVECGRLANHFLDDFEDVSYTERQELALAIQQAIEDWFMVHQNLKERK